MSFGHAIVPGQRPYKTRGRQFADQEMDSIYVAGARCGAGLVYFDQKPLEVFWLSWIVCFCLFDMRINTQVEYTRLVGLGGQVYGKRSEPHWDIHVQC